MVCKLPKPALRGQHQAWEGGSQALEGDIVDMGKTYCRSYLLLG